MSNLNEMGFKLKSLNIKSRFAIPVAAIIFVLFVSLRSDTTDRDRILMEALMRSMNNMHFSPLKIDDSYSEKVFDNYLKITDNFKKILIQPDIDALQIYHHDIDDQINSFKFDFFDAVNNIYGNRLEEAASYYREAIELPMDFTVDEIVELDPDKLGWSKSQSDLKEEWRKAVKYQVMIRIYQDTEAQESLKKKGDSTFVEKSVAEIESGAIDQVKKMYDDYFDRLKKETRKDKMENYLNAITMVYDPHSNYMAPARKENFDITMAGKLEGIGAVLTQRGGLIQVEEIMPGSPSWKQGELKAGDVILKVAQGDEEPIDITSMRLDEAVRLIRGKKGTEARLTVRKKSTDEITTISIIRDVIEMEQTFARSAVISQEKDKKVGYLYLPRFYADFNNPFTGRFCSNDIKKEIDKLKAAEVDAIIFDLRNNGGGSLADVVKIAGYFFDKGPVVQVKDRIEGLKVMNDVDATVNYNGPVVVMVNNSSASASEIFASAMQDYKRAVVIGSPATYGKGTVQRLVDLDQLAFTAPKEVKPLGTLKLTTQKFYRINGGSTQLKGVTPDIILPDPYMFLNIGEKDMDNPMAWSMIEPAKYNQWTGHYGDIEELKRNSEKRVTSEQTFIEIQKYAGELKIQRDQTAETLSLEEYKKKQKDRKARAEEMEKLLKGEKLRLDISLLQQDINTIAGDTIKEKLYNDWINGLKKDIYLTEAVCIVGDIIQPSVKSKLWKRKK